MRNTTILTLAAALVVGGLSGSTFAEDKTVGERVENAVENLTEDKNEGMNQADQAPKLPPGIAAKENDDVGDVRSSLITIVNRVMTQDNFDDAIGYLANQDRDRVNAELKDSYKDLEGKVEQLRGLFKQKYNEDFELKSGALNAVTSVQQGEVTDAAEARKHWPVPVMGEGKAKSDRPGDGQVDDKFENGRDVAVVRLQGADQKPLMLSMQYELPDYWVLDVPNDVNARSIVERQGKTIQQLIDSKDQWPENKDQAYQAIAYQVIKGFYTDDQPGVAGEPRE